MSDYKSFYQKNLERGFIVALLLVIFLLQLLPKRFPAKKVELAPHLIRFIVQEVPRTKQTIRRGQPVPQKPAVPIASEEPEVPEDQTIDSTVIRWNAGDSPYGSAGLTAGKLDTLPPRPIVQVMPEYPEELRKKGVKGVVRLLVRVDENGMVQDVVISSNSTGNQECENAAREAAYQSRYVPAYYKEKTLSVWTICEYSFKPN
jgi:TonB family protein